MRILEIERAGGLQRIATFLSDEDIALLHGIPPQAVVGVLAEDDSLHINALFREFLHETIAVAAPLDPALQAAAQASGDGRIVYIDDRLPEGTTPVPGEDILGWFQVRAGEITAGTYLPNPGHTIEGAHGFTAAVAALRQPLLEALLRREAR